MTFHFSTMVGMTDNGWGFTQWHLQKVSSYRECLCAIALKPVLCLVFFII
jgi:hypothetical protein